jgi:hypothetical protein
MLLEKAELRLPLDITYALKNLFFTQEIITCIYQVFTRYIFVSSAATFLAFLVSQARLDVSDLECLLILSVFVLKPLQLEAGGCRNSTSMCSSHKYGCSCVMQGLDQRNSEFKGLLLPCCVLVQNGRGRVVIKEALKG